MLENKIKKIIKHQEKEQRLGDKRAEQFWEKIKALTFYGLTDAQILAQLSGKAAAAFDWNDKDLSKVNTLAGKEIVTPANPAAGYNKIYCKADDLWYTLDSDGNEAAVGGGGGAVIPLPSTRMDDYIQTNLDDYLTAIHDKNENITEFGVGTYTHGVTAVNYAYSGGVYSPTQNRIYLVPSGQADETNWHYIDCSDGSVNVYAHGVTAVNDAYLGGVYSPTQNRIYLVPYGQADETNWHYIQEYSIAEISPSLMAGALFNKL